MVKGTEMEAYNTKQATTLLINFYCDTLAVSTNELFIDHNAKQTIMLY